MWGAWGEGGWGCRGRERGASARAGGARCQQTQGIQCPPTFSLTLLTAASTPRSLAAPEASSPRDSLCLCIKRPPPLPPCARSYATFVEALEASSRDNLEFLKDRAVKAMYELLVAKPEQVRLCGVSLCACAASKHY